jgi:hypothetical protein
MNNKIKPALIGGVVLGLLSVIPFVNLVNFCCCLWAILGGMLASYLYIKSSPTPVGAGDGAVLGAISGVLGGVIVLVIGIPVQLVMGAVTANVLAGFLSSMDPNQADMMRQQIATSQTVVGAIVNQVITAVLLIIFSTVGGLLGIPIFEKRKGDLTPPPPPANMGGGSNPYAA